MTCVTCTSGLHLSTDDIIRNSVDIDSEGNVSPKGITQNVVADANNSTETNILAGATWTGTSTSTLGVVGLQFSIKTDQNCTVYIDQSPDGTNWDITDQYTYIHSFGGDGWTTQALNSYVRVRITNNSNTATTYLRAQMALCPIAEPLPRALSKDGRLKSECHIADQNDTHVRVSGQNELFTTPVYRLVGTSFNNSYYDTNFWLKSETNSGTVTFDGDATITTSTNAAGEASLSSVRKARFVPGSSNVVRGLAKLTTVPVADNIRRFGAYDDDDGYFFQVNGTTFGVGYRKATVDTIITNGSFNGVLGEEIEMTTAKFSLAIEYGTGGVAYYLNNKLLHKVTVTTETLTETLTLKIKAESINTGSTVDNGILLFNTSIFRIGELQTATASKYISTNTTTILKYGAGNLHRIVITDDTGNINIYDGLTAVNPIALIDVAKNGVVQLDFNVEFSTGLTIVTSGGAKLTVIYE